MAGGAATHAELSWVGASITLGAIVGTLIAGFLAQCIGKKTTLMALAVPNFIFWILTYVAKTVTEIIVGRFISGITGKNTKPLKLNLEEYFKSKFYFYLRRWNFPNIGIVCC